MAIAYAGLARRGDADFAWLAQARMDAHATLGRRAEALEITVKQIAKETRYPLRFWWKRIKARMERGQSAYAAYRDELENMRDVHARGWRLC